MAKIIVTDGWITLEGEVDYWYQKAADDDLVRFLPGVKGLTNRMTLKPTATPPDVDAMIEAAFARSGVLQAKDLKVKATGNHVTLTGRVDNWHQHAEAERSAWSAAGVVTVDNRISVHR